MKLRSLFLLGTALALLFALGFLLGPAIILKFFGLTTGKTEVFLGQGIGAGLVGLGVLSWFAKDFDPQALQGAVLSLFICSAIAFVVALLAVLSQVTRASSAWLIVVLFLAFAAGFAYFQFLGPRE
jgi:hypothetical protein